MAQELLKKLETAITNNHKQAYIDTIFDFTDNDILSLTEDEINTIFTSSQKINIGNIGEFFDYITNEGGFCLNNAANGINELNNALLCRFYFGLYINLFREKNKKYASVLMNQGVAYKLLSEMGINSQLNLENAIKLYKKSRNVFAQDTKYTLDCASAMMNEANARQILADIGVKSEENLDCVIELCKIARNIFAQDTKYTLNCASTMMNEASARQILADIGVKSEENLDRIIELCKIARATFAQDTKNVLYCARTMLNEANALKSMADIYARSKENLDDAIELCKSAIELCKTARALFVPDTPDCAGTMLNEANARQILANIGVESEKNLKIAIELHKKAIDIFAQDAKNSHYRARTMLSEANGRQILANIGVESEKNLKIAIELCKTARAIFVQNASGRAHTMVNEAIARQILANIDVESEENLDCAERLYKKSIAIFESLDNCMAYSIALLNLNNFLIGNFRKSGERGYIEEAKKILGNAEKKIKKRDVRNKNTILAKLHENKAILLEFEGRRGIDMAAREYAEAYNLTGEPFYKFMDEFCRSRIDIEPDTKPFCMLMSRWDETEKGGIFLDYYDYSVFECHIENAVDSTGLSREEEFRAAVKKLQEIRDRTQVKTMKDRVSAYVNLMQAVVDGFRHDTYEAAKDNVRAACTIFNEYDDNDGKKICDKFYAALIENKSEDAWMELIRNKDGISCPFYRLLKEGADKKRAEMGTEKLYKTVDRIETKVDDISIKISELQNELNSGFDRIKEKIEQGFEDEKEQHQVIIDGLDVTQQKLNRLLIMSKDIEGEEGESIRQFSKQILELVENEDSDALKQFIKNIIGSESSFISSIEQSANPKKHKDEAKEELETTLSGFKGMSAKVKKEAGRFGRNVTYNVAAALMAEEIIKYIFPLITTATIGIPIPIPSQLLDSLSKAVKG